LYDYGFDVVKIYPTLCLYTAVLNTVENFKAYKVLAKLKMLIILILSIFELAASTSSRARTSLNTLFTAIQQQDDIYASSDLSFKTLYSLNREFWDRFIYPNNVKEALSVNSTLFSEDVIGRVDDSRTFYGRELNTEYVFGSFATLGSNTSIVSVLGLPIHHENLRFATNKNVASVTELVLFNLTLINRIVPVQIDIWFAFNTQEQIIAYDVSFRWFAWLFDRILQSIGGGEYNRPDNSTTKSLLKSSLVRQICETASKHCAYSNTTQYDNKSQCVEFLSQKIRLGSSYEFGMNTILCRSLHELMVPLRPDVHCPHIGPTGGGMCMDDIDYDTVAETSIVSTNGLGGAKNRKT
jgi:hypothetical protein